MIDLLFPKLHKEGHRFLVIAGVITFVLLLISNFFGIVSLIIKSTKLIMKNLLKIKK